MSIPEPARYVPRECAFACCNGTIAWRIIAVVPGHTPREETLMSLCLRTREIHAGVRLPHQHFRP